MIDFNQRDSFKLKPQALKSAGIFLIVSDSSQPGEAASTKATYSFIASSLDLPLTAFHASHLARASSCTAHGWLPVTSPTVACSI